MAQANIDLACRELIFGRNKVCGITRQQDAAAIINAGALFGGLIFAEKSPRYVTPQQAQAIQQLQRPLNWVGVFVNHNIEQLLEIAVQLKLFAVQLHGQEDQQYIDRLKQQFAQAGVSCQIWKAIAVSTDNAQQALTIPQQIDTLVYDSKHAGQFGGTGTRFNWQIALPQKQQAMLAGGLDPSNAEQASQQGFAGLDFNSGLESSPAIKDSQLINAAFSNIRI